MLHFSYGMNLIKQMGILFADGCSNCVLDSLYMFLSKMYSRLETLHSQITKIQDNSKFQARLWVSEGKKWTPVMWDLEEHFSNLPTQKS